MDASMVSRDEDCKNPLFRDGECGERVELNALAICFLTISSECIMKIVPILLIIVEFTTYFVLRFVLRMHYAIY